MTKEQVSARIRELAVIPAIRAANARDALFAAQAVWRGGLPIVELATTAPEATNSIARLVEEHPEMIVGAGTVLNLETARACLDAGAAFITSPGLDVEVVEYVAKAGTLAMPGALTPTEIMAAVKAGVDFVKIFPCSQVGGVDYLHALKAPFPDVQFIATGGVNQQTADKYLAAGASAVGVGSELVPARAIATRESDWIEELARRFVQIVSRWRSEV